MIEVTPFLAPGRGWKRGETGLYLVSSPPRLLSGCARLRSNDHGEPVGQYLDGDTGGLASRDAVDLTNPGSFQAQGNARPGSNGDVGMREV